MIQTEKRKLDHITICLTKNVNSSLSTGFEDIQLVHKALPTINKNEIDMSTEFLGKKIDAPIIIGCMTGGTKEATKINKNLARAAEELNIAMGIGSQRAAIENEKLIETYQVRDVAPRIPLIANLGIAQFINDYSVKEASKAISDINADALAMHLNAVQEASQKNGNTDWTDSINKLNSLCEVLKEPVIAKETGAGISREIASKLDKSKVYAIEIGGLGGTSWGYVEYLRSDSETGKTFRDWGIPTAVSLIECESSTKKPLIAAGGIRTGIDIAKAIALGADYVAIALPLLEPATKSWHAVKEKLEQIIDELKTAMFLVDAKNLIQLKNRDVIITGKTKEWLELRGIKSQEFANRGAFDFLKSAIGEKINLIK